MTKVEFTFLSLSHSIEMIFESETNIDDFTNDFLFLFVEKEDIDYEKKSINIQSLQKNTSSLKSRVESFITKYQSTNIKVFQLKTYFQKLKEDEDFLVLPEINISTEQSINLFNFLTSLKDGEDFEKITEKHDSLFGELTKTYLIRAVNGDTKKTIGETEKSKRICRFCKNTKEPVTFKNIAHAISESLGNKKIILNEECDKCNSDFGSANGIESSLITYLKLYGNFFGVKGKNGIAKIKGKNFELSNEGVIELKYYSDNDEEANDNKESLTEANFKLDTHDNIVMQDIYKTLCKYSLSVIDTEFIKEFEETIDWINGKKEITELPKVAILASYDFFKTHPSLNIYLRKDENKNLPYAVGEFHYTYLTFVFIIPLAKLDDKKFIDKDEFKVFWDFFKHYNLTKGWDHRNFSDNTKRKFTINLKMKQR